MIDTFLKALDEYINAKMEANDWRNQEQRGKAKLVEIEKHTALRDTLYTIQANVNPRVDISPL